MDANAQSQGGLRNQLILAGIQELHEQGIQKFSVRHTANRCGVSCAAPYKHFKDKNSFIAAIITYINHEWDIKQREIASEYVSTREKLVAVCVAYIRFLAENPQYRSIIMLKYDDIDEEHSALRGKLSMQTYVLVSQYCKEVNMPPDVRMRKTFVIRSIIYGAALMFDNGELEYTQENMDMVACSLDREFDLT